MVFSAIAAGFLIGLGGIINLKIGGVLGAIFFSLGLMIIVTFNYHLFTGQAGKLITKEIKFWKLMAIWGLNAAGIAICAVVLYFSPLWGELSLKAAEIVLMKNEHLFVCNIMLGVFCGVLMYVAVEGFKRSNNYLFVVMPVAFFILCGFNHCIADIFYTIVGMGSWWHLIPTTIGNIIGCNLLPFWEISQIRIKKKLGVDRVYK